MTALAAAVSGFRILADGSPRITIDFSPTDGAAVFQMCGSIGQPVAVAGLNVGFEAVPAAPKEKLGPLCLEANDLARNAAFQQWLSHTQGTDRTEKAAANWIRSTCAIDSRKELDTDEAASEMFIRDVRRAFMNR